MRLIEVADLRIGMVVGKTMYGPNGEILLEKGAKLKESLLETVRHSILRTVYIDDGFSKGIEPTDIIDEQFRNETIRKVKSFFTLPVQNMDSQTISTYNQEIGIMLQSIIDQVLSSRDSVVNLVSLKDHDDYTFQHSVNVAVIAAVLGVAMGYRRDQLTELVNSAVFHDIGKMFIDKEIINKPSKLTPKEFDIIKQHPLLGYDFAKNMLNMSSEGLAGILQHHEKYIGGGYPHNKKGKEISRNAQIIAIADVFDAITSKRAYHDANLPSEGIEYIMGNSGSHFAPDVVDIFLRKVAAYPLGSVVELSNGMKGVVCANYEGYTLRPTVKIFTDNPSQMYVNLTVPGNAFITITKIIY